MYESDKEAFRKAIDTINRIGEELAIILVINSKTHSPGSVEFGRFSTMTEYFSDQELESMIEGFKSFAGYIDINYSEKEFINKVSTNYFSKIQKKYKVVYSATGGGIFKCKSSTVPAICDLYGLPYCSNDAYTSALLENKVHAFNLLKHYKFPVAPFWIYDKRNGWHNGEKPPSDLRLIAKPAYQCASIGIDSNSVSKLNPQFYKHIQSQSSLFNQPLIIQQFISGYEVEVPILDLANPVAAGSMAITVEGLKELGDIFLSYDSISEEKYDYYDFDKENINLSSKLKKVALDSYKLLDLSGSVRVDYRVCANDFFITDYNNTPHLNEFHSFGKLFKNFGYEYADMLKCLCYSAVKKLER